MTQTQVSLVGMCYNWGMNKKQPQIVDGTTLWQCPICSRWLSASSFYPSKRTSNGITSECRTCHIRISIKTRDIEKKNESNRRSMRKVRELNPELFRARERLASQKRIKDIRYYARQIVRHAIAGGIIVKPRRCEKCGQEKKLTGHHQDYTKPLEIEWLCYECHGNR